MENAVIWKPKKIVQDVFFFGITSISYMYACLYNEYYDPTAPCSGHGRLYIWLVSTIIMTLVLLPILMLKLCNKSVNSFFLCKQHLDIVWITSICGSIDQLIHKAIQAISLSMRITCKSYLRWRHIIWVERSLQKKHIINIAEKHENNNKLYQHMNICM